MLQKYSAESTVVLEMGPSAGFPPGESGWSTKATLPSPPLLFGEIKPSPPPPELPRSMQCLLEEVWAQTQERSVTHSPFTSTSPRWPSCARPCSWHQGTAGSTANQGAGSLGVGSRSGRVHRAVRTQGEDADKVTSPARISALFTYSGPPVGLA